MGDRRVAAAGVAVGVAAVAAALLWLRTRPRPPMDAPLVGGAAGAGEFCGCPLLRQVVPRPHFAADAGAESPPAAGCAGPKRVLLILNPASGSSAAQRRQRAAALQEGLATAAAAGLAVERVDTERPGHATDIAETVDLSGIDAVCVAGGDGSLREVVQGMLQRTDGAAVRVPVVPIPTGTSNNFARDLGLDSPAAAFEALTNGGARRPVDAVEIAHGVGAKTYSINVICWGLTYEAATTVRHITFPNRGHHLLWLPSSWCSCFATGSAPASPRGQIFATRFDSDTVEHRYTMGYSAQLLSMAGDFFKKLTRIQPLKLPVSCQAESLRMFGPVRYDIAGFWHIMQNKRRAAEIRLQAVAGGEWVAAAGDFALGMLQNTRCSGRAFAFAPLAQV